MMIITGTSLLGITSLCDISIYCYCLMLVMVLRHVIAKYK